MKRQYINLAICALLSFGGLSIVLISTVYGKDSYLLLVIFFAGSIGSVINNYFRLSKISLNPEAVRNEIDKPVVTIQMYVSLFISGVLGFVAYGLFLSGMLQGEMFPTFMELDEEYSTLKDLLEEVAPKQNIDAAKAIIWAFIAGFSERFIPNVLDTLVAKAESDHDQ